MEVSPAQNPSCKPAGGKREVKTRMEEPGGGWRREDFSNLFDLASKLVCSQSLAGVIILYTLLSTCGLICEEVDWEQIILMEVNVFSLSLFQMLPSFSIYEWIINFKKICAFFL